MFLYNIYINNWDDELLKLFDIFKSIFLEIKLCSEEYGLIFLYLFLRDNES